MKKNIQDPSVPEIVDEMPAIPHRVLYADLPFYSDPECTQEVKDGRLMILEAIDPDDPIKELDVVPTRKKYAVGQLLAWDLYKDKMWETCWYRHPETGNIERAWKLHVEFIGKVVSERAQAAFREEDASGQVN
jgi:hypothetical protein